MERMQKMNETNFNTPQWQEFFKDKSPKEIDRFKKLLEELQDKTTVKKGVYFKDKWDGTYSQVGTIADEVSVFSFDYKYFIQKIQYTQLWAESEGEKYGYRVGYYTIDKKITRIIWGQFASQICGAAFKELIEKAKEKFFS